MLPADALAGMRETLNDSLPGTAIVQTRTWVSDGGGGGTTSWVAAGTYDCRIAPTGGADNVDKEIGDRLHPETEFVITLPASFEADTEDRVVTAGGTFEVIGVTEPRTWEISSRLQVKVIK